MRTDLTVEAELDDFVARADAGRSVYITRVRQCLEKLDPGTTGIDLVMALESAGDLPSREFGLRLPVSDLLTSSRLELIREYVGAAVYNLISTFGGRSLEFRRPAGDSGIDELLESVISSFHPESSKQERLGYGRCLNVAERTADALEALPPGTTRFRFSIGESSEAGNGPRNLEASGSAATGGTAGIRALKELPDRLEGLSVLGMDIGGSDIKTILALDGRIVAYKEYDWFPAHFRQSLQLVDPVLLIARWARARAAVESAGDSIPADIRKELDAVSPAEVDEARVEAAIERAETALNRAGIAVEGLDRIGLCFPDVVVRDKIVGGEVYKTRGIRNNPDIDYETDFRNLTDLDIRLTRYCRPGTGGPAVRIINDGPMAAFTSAVEGAYADDPAVLDGVFAHTLGTELGTGWLDESARLPEIPLEVYNYVIDLGCRTERRHHPDDPRSLNNFNTGIAGTLQKYISQSGVFRLAMKYFPVDRPDLYSELFDAGFLEDGGDDSIRIRQEPRDMRKPLLEHLMALTEREGSQGVCGDVFREIGEYLAVTWEETNHLMHPAASDRVLFGRLVKNPVCFNLMQEGAARISPDLRLVVADDESAWTPLMRQLRDDGVYTVAQFAQAVGAAHFAVL